MPAPTALVQPAAAPEPAVAPAPEQKDELLVDMQEASAVEPTAVAPPANADDTDMAIDEEGRPRFAPGKDVVCPEPRDQGHHERTNTFLTVVSESGTPRRDKKDSNSAKSHVCPEEQLVQGKQRRTPFLSLALHTFH